MKEIITKDSISIRGAVRRTRAENESVNKCEEIITQTESEWRVYLCISLSIRIKQRISCLLPLRRSGLQAALLQPSRRSSSQVLLVQFYLDEKKFYFCSLCCGEIHRIVGSQF